MLHRGATPDEAKRKVDVFRRMVLTKERVLVEMEAKKKREEEARAEEGEEESETPTESESEPRKSPVVKWESALFAFDGLSSRVLSLKNKEILPFPSHFQYFSLFHSFPPSRSSFHFHRISILSSFLSPLPIYELKKAQSSSATSSARPRSISFPEWRERPSRGRGGRGLQVCSGKVWSLPQVSR